MSHFDRQERSSDWGRGTGKPLLSSSNQDLLREEEEESKYGEGSETTLSPVPRPQSGLLSYAADDKGKDTALFDRTLVGPNERPWHTLDKEQVRYRATTVPAVLLNKGERQAAGRDPGLEWDDQRRTYRLRRKATSAPQAAGGGQ